MTRKDFILIAKVLSSAKNHELIGHLAERFADALRGTNANFDRERFIRACMGE